MNRVWAYVISKPLNESELAQLSVNGKQFVTSWTAHENKLSADFQIFKNRIIIVKVNEHVANASGCSIDKLTRFIKESEANFGVELLNRLLIAYKQDDGINVVHSSKIKELLSQNTISAETIVYNTSLANENELQNWEEPLKNTWLNKYLN